METPCQALVTSQETTSMQRIGHSKSHKDTSQLFTRQQTTTYNTQVLNTLQITHLLVCQKEALVTYEVAWITPTLTTASEKSVTFRIQFRTKEYR